MRAWRREIFCGAYLGRWVTLATPEGPAQAVAVVANRDNDIPLTDVVDATRQLLASQDDLAHSGGNSARAAECSFRALDGGWST